LIAKQNACSAPIFGIPKVLGRFGEVVIQALRPWIKLEHALPIAGICARESSATLALPGEVARAL
jgi:hypothetical protein